ncbi:hypothetical protein GCM10020001_021510 [Nonomuraea salmonea]
MDIPWWRDAVVYEIYVRSFADASGDGVGDLAGIRERLPYLRRLGVDAIWLTPFYPSPMADGGYDVADYRGVDPMFGSLDDFDALVTQAHELGLRVLVDVVPNHSSSAHPWFQEALRGVGRDRYIFRDHTNNWKSTFSGPAWTQTPDGQYYLHLFAPEQPDFNWRNREVHEEFLDVLRFWLERGVDGFRIDVAMGLYKAEGLPDVGDQSFTSVSPVWGGSRRCTASTASGGGCSTPTRGSGWRWARCGPTTPRTSPATYAPTSCTRASTSPGWRRRGRPPRSAR